MAGASLGPIYDRLSGAQRYHPFTAKTFADWSSEAGDTVQISQDGTTYTSPVHKQSLVWRGKHMINMETTGTRERVPIERISNRKENDTSAGMSAARGYGGGAGKKIEALQYDFYSEDGAYQSQLRMDEQQFRTIFTKTGIDGLGPNESLSTMISQNAEAISLEAIRAKDQEAELYGRIQVEADKITAEVARAKGVEGELSGKIVVEAGKISQIVRAVGKDGEVSAASICLAINQSGESQAVINAGKIYLLGQTIANTITADYISAKVAAIPRVNMQTMHANYVYADVNLYLPNGLSVWAAGVQTVTLTGPTNNIYTLKQTTFNGTETEIGTFSRATTLSGTWSGGIFTVSATPQGNQVTAGLFDVTNADVTWSGNRASFPVYANLNGGETKYATGKTLSVDASDIYTAGYNSGHTIGYNAGYTTGGSTASVSGTNSISSNGTYIYKGVYENQEGDDVETGHNLTVNVEVSTPSPPTPSNVRVSTSASGTSLGTLSGTSPGKHILFNLGSTIYDIFLV